MKLPAIKPETGRYPTAENPTTIMTMGIIQLNNFPVKGKKETMKFPNPIVAIMAQMTPKVCCGEAEKKKKAIAPIQKMRKFTNLDFILSPS